MKSELFYVIRLLIISLLFENVLYAQVSVSNKQTHVDIQNRLYPESFSKKPDLASPLVLDDGTEIVLVGLRSGKFALLPVTVERGDPLHYSYRVGTFFGKDDQLHVDDGDFPTLAKTGLHSESELSAKKMITGLPVSLITYIARPQRYSHAGFMADDEDILSVLKADNARVRELGLTHPQLAKPLFHVWNIILKEIELGNWARFYDNIQHVYYNNKEIQLRASGDKGWQISIFQDEIQGRFQFDVICRLSDQDSVNLNQKYAHLSPERRDEMIEKLTHIHFSEMVPYYIMRYGFYEGHTVYRSDPLAIAFIFGLRSLDEIETSFNGRLYETLTTHFTRQTDP